MKGFPKYIPAEIRMHLLEYITKEVEDVRSLQVSEHKVAINHRTCYTTLRPALILDLREKYIMLQYGLHNVAPKIHHILEVTGATDALRSLPFKIRTTSDLLEPKEDSFLVSQNSRAILWKYSWGTDTLSVVFDGYRYYRGEYDPIEHRIIIPDATDAGLRDRHLDVLKNQIGDGYNPDEKSPIEIKAYGRVNVDSNGVRIEDAYDVFEIIFTA